MTLERWFRNTHQQFQENGLKDGIYKGLVDLGIGGIRRIDPQYGISPFDYEWDLFIILDACRADMMKEVFDEYEFLRGMDIVYSNAYRSREWMQKNMIKENTQNLTYITGNLFTGKIPLDHSSFKCIKEVWKTSWDDDFWNSSSE